MKTQRFPFAVSYWTGDRATATTLQAGENFRFDLDALYTFCLGGLPRHLVDLLRIASAVYVVDRLERRRPKGGSRTIGLKVAVFQDSLWKRQDVREVLHEALEFVTGDFWDIEFEPDTQPFHGHPRLFPDPYAGRSPLICLYSGGLDSAAGLVARMKVDPTRPVIPVTVWHQPRQRRLVRQHYDLLRGYFRGQSVTSQIDPLIVKVAMKWKPVAEKKDQETSQRSRSFLFTALGAITAAMHRQQVVEMYESGVGAINLPLMAGMAGPKATRSSHPEFLRRMSRLVSLVADSELTITLPFEDRTKGEVVEVLADPELRAFAAMSASCVHFPIRHKKYKQCGFCPACIFRRVALASARIEEPDDAYQYDIFGPAERINTLPEKRLAYLKAFLLQVARLRGIENRDRLPPAFERHVVPHIVPKGQSQKGVIQLLARHRKEWTEFVSAARKHGHAWARLLAPQRPATPGVIHASA
jgi:7-cyano-7-deazaguanine synthase in queuosine biosynthesis